MIHWRWVNWVISASVAIILTGCASYYTQNIKFQNAVETGEFETANKILEKDTKTPQGKNRLLYYLNRGYVSWMLGDNKNSVSYLNTAENTIDDYSKSLGAEALALISNPMVKPYKAEDFEVVMVNCFKAINYMQMFQSEEALVECRRINLKLNQLNDKYKDHKNRYQQDAFANTMMGLLYDADRDYNNAFIAYRNALNVYDTDYTKNFDLGAPNQLKQDLLRTAYLSGLGEELNFYERKFNMKYAPEKEPYAQMIYFWMNGFGPVKDEWSINFTILKGSGGMVTFVNEEFGFSFPFFLGDSPDNGITDLKLIRVAFPKYVERKPLSQTATVSSNGKVYPLELAENINNIAFKTLNDRMLREMGSSLLRLAAKQAMEAATRGKDETAGFILGIVNAVTEKADTRNWQTLPYAISYTRIPLQEGSNEVGLNVKMIDGKTNTHQTSLQPQKNRTYFQAFHSLN